MNVLFRHGKEEFLRRLFDAWPSGVVRCTAAPSPRSKLFAVVAENVGFVPYALFTHSGSGIRKDIGRALHVVPEKRRSTYFVKAKESTLRLHRKK